MEPETDDRRLARLSAINAGPKPHLHCWHQQDGWGGIHSCCGCPTVNTGVKMLTQRELDGHLGPHAECPHG